MSQIILGAESSPSAINTNFSLRSTRVADVTAPTVQTYLPTDGAINIAKNLSDVQLTFNEPIQKGTGLIELRTAAGNIVATFDVSNSTASAPVTIPVGSPAVINISLNGIVLSNNTQYLLIIPSGAIKDLSGNSYVGTATYDFKTIIGDIVAPKVVTYSPADGATNLPTLFGDISIVFSEPITLGSGMFSLKTATGVIEEFDAALTVGGGVINGTAGSVLTVSGSAITIAPAANLIKNNTQYYFEITNGAVLDIAGNPFGGVSTYDFKTAPGDTTPPLVTAFNPISGATNIATDQNVEITFSEPVSFGAGVIALRNATDSIIKEFYVNNGLVNGLAPTVELNFSSDGKTLIFNPVTDLLKNSKYKITIENGAVKDAAGNSYIGTSTYNFTTAPGDITAPTVINFSPEDGALNASTINDIVITFSEDIKKGVGDIVLKTDAGAIVESFRAENISPSGRVKIQNNQLVINPTFDLELNKKYFLILPVGSIKDLSDNSYVGTSNYDFKTVPGDIAAPIVNSFVPANGEENIPVSSSITLVFDEAIRRGTGLIVLRTESGAEVESFNADVSSRIGISSNTLTITPSSNLLENTRYFLQLENGSVLDLANNKFAGIDSYSFKTIAGDVTPPTVRVFSPADDSGNVSVSANIVLTFSEAIQKGIGAVVLYNADGIVESFDVASGLVTVSGDTVILNPTVNLKYNTQYFVDFPAGSIKDRSGNMFNGTANYDFTTIVGDTSPPLVSSFSPADGATNVSKSIDITLNFNEPVTKGVGLITVRTADQQIVETIDVATSTLVKITGNTVVINPINDLSNNKEYYIFFENGTFKDDAGNAYVGTTAYHFRTILGDSTPPVITIFSPMDGAENVPIATNIIANFSEAVQRGAGKIILSKENGSVVETFNVESSDRLILSGNVLTINPTNDLLADTRYTIKFETGSIKDLESNLLSELTTYDFKTIPQPPTPDFSAPTIVGFEPKNGAGNVDKTSDIIINFDENIKKGSGTIVLKNSLGSEVFDVTNSERVQFAGSTLIIDPVKDLVEGQTYKVIIGTTVVQDASGNYYSGLSDYQFKIGISGAVDSNIIGTSVTDRVSGTVADDKIMLKEGVDFLLLRYEKQDYKLFKTLDGWLITSSAEGVDVLQDVERLVFADKVVALDIDGNAGIAYRLYQSAFNRSPDSTGLGYWIGAIDSGINPLDVAIGFVNSQEFQSIYGENPETGNIVAAFYQNVLGRAYDQAGYSFYVNEIDQGKITIPEFLLQMSESPENKTNAIKIIGSGFEYTPWVG